MSVPATRPPIGPVGRTRPRRRRWWRWVAGGVIGLALILFAAAVAYIKLQPSPAPLTIPHNSVGKPAGPLDGTWITTTGSLAGFRVKESFLGISNDVVGRTSAVTGTIVISGNQVSEAVFRVDLPTIEVSGKTERAFDQSLDTSAHRYATVALAAPLTIRPSFISGINTMTTTTQGEMTMHGATHPVTITIACRRDVNDLQAAGSIPITFSAWGIAEPTGYGSIAGLANHGIAEFYLHLRRASGVRK